MTGYGPDARVPFKDLHEPDARTKVTAMADRGDAKGRVPCKD